MKNWIKMEINIDKLIELSKNSSPVYYDRFVIYKSQREEGYASLPDEYWAKLTDDGKTIHIYEVHNGYMDSMPLLEIVDKTAWKQIRDILMAKYSKRRQAEKQARHNKAINSLKEAGLIHET